MPNYSSNNLRLAKNSIFLSFRMVIVLGITLYTTRVLLRLLGVEDYGVYNVVCGFATMFSFLNTSMSNGIQRFFNYEYGKNGEEGANRVYCTAINIQLILAIVILVLTESVGLWYLHHKMVIPVGREIAAEWIFQFAIISFLFVIMQAPFTAAVMAHEKMDFYAIVSVFDVFLKLGIVLSLSLFSSDKLIIYGLLFALISMVNFIIYYAYCKNNFNEIKYKRVHDNTLFKSMLGFSGWNIFGSLSGVMKETGINLVINFFFGPVVNAARGIATQVNGGLQSFVTNITIPVRPQVIQSYACGELNRAMSLTYSISKLSCCFLLMMAIPASLEIDYLLHLWLGKNVPEHAGIFTIIILGISLVNNLNSATSGIVHATGIMKDYQLWGSLIGISSVPIAFFLLLYYKLPEIALLSVLVCSMVGHLVCLLVVRRLVGMSLRDYFKEVVWPIIIVFTISLVITYMFHNRLDEGWCRLCLVTICGVITVFLSSFFFALNNNERTFFIQIFRNFYSKLK